MHSNFHLSGDETPEQSRRIANAVLALGGLPHDSTGALLHGFDLASGPDVTTVSTVENGKPLTHVVVEEAASPAEIKAVIDLFEPAPLTAISPPPIGGVPTDFHDPSYDKAKDPFHVDVAPPVSPASGQDVGGRTPNLVTVDDIPPTTDKNGLPWDERIHSSSRAINADGTWRYRKNVPDETKQAVEAELRGAITVGQTVDVPEVPSLNADLSNIVDYAGVKAIPVPPIPTVAPPFPTSTVQRSYSDVVNLIMANQATLNKPELYVAVLGMSLPEFAAACIAKPELATVAFNALDEIRRS